MTEHQPGSREWAEGSALAELVVAARLVCYEEEDPKTLDKPLEAFAASVPWEDEPGEPALGASSPATPRGPIDWRDGPPPDELKDAHFVLGLMSSGEVTRVRWNRVQWIGDGYGSLAEITRHCPVAP